jgi:hypothetical protein
MYLEWRNENIMIKENISNVEARIKAACKKAGRDVSDVTLIAVSKTKPVSDIEEAYEYGTRDYGENKVQELCDKYPVLPKDIKWHLIGHLQRNKVKYIVDKVHLIHSVDSLRLAEQISIEAVKKNVIANILVQVNIANEDTKFGLKEDETIDMIKNISILPGVHIKGLMTIAPFTTNSEDNRKYFRGIKELSETIARLEIPNVEMKELSMGMTGDYEVAVEEGATLVRVGTGIFGNRNYNKL